MKKENEKHPHFIPNSPCGVDQFEGHSHTTVADCIFDVLRNDESCRIVGIDGGWGTGKSNLIELVRKKIESDSVYHFFLYDAWGHQNDLPRRSILEELTDYLTEDSKDKDGLLNNKKWKEKKKNYFQRLEKSTQKLYQD
jgi:predicted KAP-like P-loop ATPase